MKQFLRYLVLLVIFWMLVFAVQRTIFLLYNYGELGGISWPVILLSYWHGLGMDLSATAYLSTFPIIFYIINLFARRKIWAGLANVFTLSFLIIVLFVGIIDTGLYSEWGSKINSKAISYALFPGEATKAFKAVPVWLFMMIFFAEGLLAYWAYIKWLRARVPGKSWTWICIVAGILILASIPLAIRGGFQKYPMGRNMVYYTRHMVLNYAALNGPWNLIDVLLKARSTKNPYQYYDKSKALSIVEEMQRSDCDSVINVINNKRPNILLVLLESVSAENMRSFGGKEKIMPGMDSLAKEGLLFTRYYATGFRTEQGLISILSSFPSQPTVTIMREFGKFEKLPNLGRVLADCGYTCNYYFSGNIDFANTRAYLNSSAFTKLLDKDARPWKNSTDWGSADEELFQCHLDEAASDPGPFFSIIMTSTSHEPFDATVKKEFAGNSESSGYKNTVHYTDDCLFKYIQQAKKTSWYANTLFIITSDHAHSYPLKRAKFEAERHHIPLLFLGGALKQEWKGKTMDHIGSQTDLSATLLSQLGVKGGQFIRSMDILDPCKPQFAFYTFDNGFGLITPEQTLIFDHDLQQVVYREKSLPAAQDEKILKQGKAYLQMMFEEYLNLNR